ncbi:MAG: chromate transporter [Hyphomicrobiales bacterium]|nr:chromate transporter [Hyphomicrobiales bacterium]
MPADAKTLATLALVFAPLSLVSVGGGSSIIAEMQHQAVAVHHWTTQREFTDLFAIARAAPGPGMLLATLIGFITAGWLGAVVVTLAFFLPSSLLMYVTVSIFNRWRGSTWHRAIEAGLAPIAIGLILAGAFAVLTTEGSGVLAWVLALAVTVFRMWRPSLHPLVLIGLGAAVFVVAHTFA